MAPRYLSFDEIKREIVQSSTTPTAIVNALAGDDDLLYSVDSAGTMMIWSMETLRHLRTFNIAAENLLCLSIDADYIYIGSTYTGAPLSVWRKDDCTPVISINDQMGSVLSLCDIGGEIIAARSSGTLDFFSKTDWMKIVSLDSQHKIATCLATDTKHIFAGGIDDYVTVFRTSIYSPVSRLEGHNADILSLCSDDDFLYSGSGEIWWGGPGSPRPPSFESSIRVWNKGTWECTMLLEGHEDNVNAIVSDKSRVYSISDDGSLRSYTKSDWTQTILPISSRPLRAMIQQEEHLIVCDSHGRILKIPKSIFEH